MFLAIAWVQHGRLPSEIRALPQGERAFLYAAQQVSAEEDAKPSAAPGNQPSGNAGTASRFRKDVLESSP